VRIAAVIPTFNYGRFVARAIESVQRQTRSVDEIIVVDDGSTDDTPEVLRRFGDAIRVIATPHLGVSAARNRGWRSTDADLIALLDADDAWRPTKLERQLDLLAEHPEAIAVGCGNRVLDAHGRELVVRFYPDPSRHRTERLRQIATRAAWVGSSNSGVLLRRADLVRVGGFDERLAAAEDWDLWLRLADLGTIHNVHEVLTEISFHRTGIFRGSPVMERSQWQVLEKLCAAWPEDIDDRTRRQVRAMIWRDAAGEQLHHRDRRAAAQRLAASLWNRPAQPEVWTSMMKIAASAVKHKLWPKSESGHTADSEPKAD
jgi:glycosyltransferase involved in cell wall biosynthesis